MDSPPVMRSHRSRWSTWAMQSRKRKRQTEFRTQTILILRVDQSSTEKKKKIQTWYNLSPRHVELRNVKSVLYWLG